METRRLHYLRRHQRELHHRPPQSAHAGSCTVTVTNSAGSATSNAATLTVNASSGSNTKYNLTGFATVGTGCTGGGTVAVGNAAYARVTTPLPFSTAVVSFNKGTGIKVIEITNDLDLDWNEIGADVQRCRARRSPPAPRRCCTRD